MRPPPSYAGEVRDAVLLDGIRVSGLVVLIACAKEHVLAWHLATSERSGAWAALMAKLAPPAMAVSDGSPGLAKAARAVRPGTLVQRRVFHVLCQVKRCTTSRPKLDAGKELHGPAKSLLKAKDADSAAKWLADYAGWCSKWDSFLREFMNLNLNLPRFRLHPYAAFRRRSSSGRSARSNSSGLRCPSAEWVLAPL